GQSFGPVHILTTAVIALAGLTFRIFKRQLGSLGGDNQWAGIVFRSNQVDMRFLATTFVDDGLPDIGIKRFKGLLGIKHGRSLLSCKVSCAAGKRARLYLNRGLFSPLIFSRG